MVQLLSYKKKIMDSMNPDYVTYTGDDDYFFNKWSRKMYRIFGKK